MYFFPDCQSQGWRRCKRTVGRISPGRAVVYISVYAVCVCRRCHPQDQKRRKIMNKPTIKEVEEWVKKLYDTCEETITPAERAEQRKYAIMVQRPQDKKFLVKMLDESSQIRDDKKLAKRIKVLIDEYGIPKFLNKRDTFLFKVYQSFGHYFYPIAIPIIKKRLRMDTSRVIIDAARPHLTKHLATRFDQKIGQNVNLLGEVVLGDEEADKRYYSYLEAL